MNTNTSYIPELRIAIIGSQSTGKTTLAKQLSEHLNIQLISEIARRFDKNILSNKTSAEYLLIQKELLKLQIEEESKLQNFVSDRSTVDNLAYWIHNCSEITNNIENALYIKKAIKNTTIYTHIFQLIPEFYPRDDGYRDTNIIYQLQIAESIHTILHLNNIKHYRLTGTKEERLIKALEILNYEK
jgi:nicotinamide riboside kinase